MTRFLKGATLALALIAAPVAVHAQALSPAVIVVVDLDRVVNESAAGKQAATELQTRVQTLQTRANTLQTQLQAEANAIQQGQANNSITGPQLEARAKAFGERQQAAQQELARSENDIQRARNFVLQQINDAAQPVITAIMRERGAQIALAEGATLQHSQGLNITNDVIARVNQSLPRVSTTPPPPQQQQQQR
jgi:outer membrane protein